MCQRVKGLDPALVAFADSVDQDHTQKTMDHGTIVLLVPISW